MKYIGNKNRLIDFIYNTVSLNNLPQKGIFIDIFSGTTNVAKFFKKRGYKLITNDFMYYSYVQQYCSIKNNKYPSFNKLFYNKIINIEKNKKFRLKNERLLYVINYLNKLKGKKGFIFYNYAPSGRFGRKFFSDENAKKIDAVRNKIEEWRLKKLINKSEFYILLTSLIDAADFVANMSGTYGAYLKIWRSMALKPFTMKVPEIIESKINHEVYQLDANLFIKKVKGDILYIDPPYNTRQYAANFHILETLALWDNPKLYGKVGLRPYENKKSYYSSKSKCNEVFKDLIKNANVKYIIMSYSNEGIMSEDYIKEILSNKGNLKVYNCDYRRFRTERDHEKRHYKVLDDKVKEFIYFVKVK